MEATRCTISSSTWAAVKVLWETASADHSLMSEKLTSEKSQHAQISITNIV